MDKGAIARLLSLAEGDVSAFAETPDGTLVTLNDGAQRLIRDDGVFAYSSHDSNKQLRAWVDQSEESNDEPETEPEPERDAGVSDDVVPSGSAEDVLNWVSGDPVKAQRALDAEESADNPRKVLTNALKRLVGVS